MNMSVKPTTTPTLRSRIGRRIKKKQLSRRRLPGSGINPIAGKRLAADLGDRGEWLYGSHVVLELLKQGEYGVIAIDSLENSSAESLRRVRELATQSTFEIVVGFARSFGYKLRDGRNAIRHVIHFAALKSVEGSRLNPAGYYSTNVLGTAGLLEVMKSSGVNSLVFSSSAVVYGSRAGPGAHHQPNSSLNHVVRQLLKNHQHVWENKLMCEELIHKLCHSHGQSNRSEDNFRAVILRYTNPSGNDPSGRIGDSTREQISIYGADYPTRDGTGVRDFIHVQDLARGHLAALGAFNPIGNDFSRGTYPNNCQTYNLGTGKGASVMEVIQALTEASGRPIKTTIAPRRPGDLATVICDPSKAERELGWKAEKGVLEMATDLWKFCISNPNGLLPQKDLK
ncbi:hypothetical protein PSTT_04017, partial [Puccinia striiformis]